MSVAQTSECCYLIGGFGPVEDVEDVEEDSNEEIKEKADQQVFQIQCWALYIMIILGNEFGMV